MNTNGTHLIDGGPSRDLLINAHYPIHSGPSRDLLIDAFKHAYADNVEVVLDFGIAAAYTSEPNKGDAAFTKLPAKAFRIERLSHEDGSGQSFNISGYCLAGYTNEALRPYGFEAYFHCRHREGWIKITSALPKL